RCVATHRDVRTVADELDAHLVETEDAQQLFARDADDVAGGELRSDAAARFGDRLLARERIAERSGRAEPFEGQRCLRGQRLEQSELLGGERALAGGGRRDDD